MIKKSLTILALLALLSSTVYSQWTNEGGWPADTLLGGTQGMAVDPDGKVWSSNYFADEEVDGKAVRSIKVYNADGTPASFSPITMIPFDGGFTLDTLLSSSYGLKAHTDGNILYTTGGGMMYKINYQTGEGIAKVQVQESSIGSPDVTDDGTIFVSPVLPGNPIRMFSADLTFLGNAVEGADVAGYRRTVAVSHDGLTLYDLVFSGKVTYIYTRSDEFSAFEKTDSAFIGWNIESCAWNPDTDLLWVSAGSYFDLPTASGVTPNTWYGVDMSTMEVMDSLKWTMIDSTVSAWPNQRPRGIDFSTDGMTAYIGCFGSSAEYPQVQKVTKGAAAPASVTFICDMSIQVDEGNFDPGSGTMSVAGSFNDWTVGATPMTDDDSDLKYEVTVEGLTSGEEIQFKFVNGTDGWESVDNRTLTPAAGENTFEAFFNNFMGGTTVSVQFSANMEFEIVAGRFDPSADTLSVRGGFNGWSSDDVMSPSVGDPNVYEVFVDMDVNENDLIKYKYAFRDASLNGDNWETGSDREYTFTADDISNQFAVISRTYNDLTIDEVLQQPADITFVVDMNGAVDVNGVAFSSVDNVFIAGAVPPLAWPGGGWPDEDEHLVHFLTDQGGGIWSVTLTFPQYSPLTIVYKFGANWGLPSNGGANDNEGGVGDDYFLSVPANLWAGTIETAFGSAGEYDLTTDVIDLNSGIPTQFTLDQNYPNPFNPTTMIRFSVPKADVVTLKVYDLLGQEVATLLSEFKSAGSYEVSFDASNLTTGVYVYTITAGQFVSSKKMMLVK